MGRGVTATKLAFVQTRDAHVQKLEEKQAELINTVEKLQTVVHDLAKGKKPDEVFISEASNGSKVVTRCQLLDWCSMDDVVGEREFCSTKPMYKFRCIPLGPNAAAVIVKSVSKEDAYVWRPTTTIVSLGHDVGTKIAWPGDRIILDNEMESPTENNTASSSASLDRNLIFDWNLEDVLVDEGSLFSTDLKELANNIPFGPNAAIVKVEKMIKEDAYLWRPSSEMFFMGNALHEFIAWPIQKIQLSNIPPSRTSPKASSPPSVSCSIDNSTLGAKKKCMLLDCNNSRQIIAEGRVCSTNPRRQSTFCPLRS